MFDVPAWSQEDALARIDKISWAKYVGEHHYTIKAGYGGGLLVRLLCLVKNTAERFKELLA
jgi:hypothetical protein